jgi:hypothetical protein
LLVEEIRRGFDSIAAQLARDLSTASSIPEATP